ncbi:MAG: polymer-forming cytoskeletal protein [Pseudomonadota bacterium]
MADTSKSAARRQGNGPTTLVAEGCVIEGTISGSSDAMVSGTIIGNSTLSGLVTIAATGEWRGTLAADDIVVSGRVDGDIIATGCIEIAATASISGSVRGAKISVAEGAIIDGEMRIGARPATSKPVKPANLAHASASAH